MSEDISAELVASIATAYEDNTPLQILGGNTKGFYGRVPVGMPLAITGHEGIVNYEPTELVVSVRAGTRLSYLKSILAESGQMLAFDPPMFGPAATVGGMVASGFSGPARPYRGSVRDAILGVQIINGKGHQLHFGGEVMKNVAGYDVSRLMVGALGTLGVVLQASFKVLPAPEVNRTLVFSCSEEEALYQMNRWAGQALPLTGAAYLARQMYVRLSGSEDSVSSAAREIGGDQGKSADDWWDSLRDHKLSFFERNAPLWRLSVPPAASPLDMPGDSLIDWGGAQRWFFSNMPATEVRGGVRETGGHSTLFRGGDRSGEVFETLHGTQARLHVALKRAFDPGGIINRGRMVKDW